MNEYQISVSRGGLFWFRTDWMDRPEAEMQQLARALQQRLSGWEKADIRVSLIAKSKVRWDVDF